MAVKMLNFAAPTVSPFDVDPQPTFSPVCGIFFTGNRDADGNYPGSASFSLGLASRDDTNAITNAAVGEGGDTGLGGTSRSGHAQSSGAIAYKGYTYDNFATPFHVGVDDFTCILSLDEDYGALDFGALLVGGRTLEAQQAELTLPSGSDTATVSGLPWRPQLVLLLAGFDGTHEGANLSFGVANETDQWAYGGYTEYLGDLFHKYAYARLKSGSACIGIRGREPGAQDWDAYCTITDDGFTLTSTNRPSEDITVFWLALYDSDLTSGFAVGITDQNASIGDHSVTGLLNVSGDPFTPQGVLLMSARGDDESLRVDNVVAIGAGDGTDSRAVTSGSLGDVSDDISFNEQRTGKILYIDVDTTETSETLVAFLNGGFTLHSAVAGSHKIGYIAIAASPGVGFLPCQLPIISASRNTLAHTMIETTTLRAE